MAFLFIGSAVALAAPATPTQDICDPTGEICSPAPPPPIEPRCSLSSNTAIPGETLIGHLENVPDGTQATLTFDGAVVGSGTATAQNGESTGSLDIKFVVPASNTGGPHQVVFSGAGFQCVASADFVMGQSISRGSSGSALSRTGLNVGILVAVALVLVVVGLQLRRAARRRRRAAEAAKRRYAHQYVR